MKKTVSLLGNAKRNQTRGEAHFLKRLEPLIHVILMDSKREQCTCERPSESHSESRRAWQHVCYQAKSKTASKAKYIVEIWNNGVDEEDASQSLTLSIMGKIA